jgi:hypothetical protein
VEVDHRPAPGCGLDILGEEKLALASSFELGEGVIRTVGLGPSEPSPADHAARPAAFPKTSLKVPSEAPEARIGRQ